MDKIKSFVKEHKLELALLLAVLLIGAFCRLYKINEYMTFLGDEGRDVIVVRRLILEHHPPLIGPGTSIGNMYLGPAYYYMMAIPLLVANFNPVGPAIFIALLGIATILFLWLVIKEWFPSRSGQIHFGALIVAFLYAISPVAIIYSRSSWNPNIMPFFSLLTIYGIWRVWIKKQYNWLIIVGISFACVLQSHYLGLLLFPVIGLTWLITFFRAKNKKSLFVYSVIGLLVFIILMSPLVFFDFRHNFINFKAMKAFFSDRQTTVSIRPWNAIPAAWPILTNISTDLVGAKNTIAGIVVAGAISLTFIYVYLFNREKYDEKKVSVILTLSLWFGLGILGMGLYKQHIYDHYYGFLFTVPFIILGGIIQYLITIKKFKIIGFVLVSVFVLFLTVANLLNSPLKESPNMQLQRAIFVAKKVNEIAAGARFNFALIADNNYDSAYRYFLNLNNAKVVDIDPQNTKSTITSELIVVCERVKEKCDPTHNAKTEIAAWGWSKIVGEWDNVFGVTIYKLGHAK